MAERKKRSAERAAIYARNPWQDGEIENVLDNLALEEEDNVCCRKRKGGVKRIGLFPSEERHVMIVIFNQSLLSSKMNEVEVSKARLEQGGDDPNAAQTIIEKLADRGINIQMKNLYELKKIA